MIHIEIKEALDAQILFCKIKQKYMCGIFVASKDKEVMIYDCLVNNLDCKSMTHDYTRNKEFSAITFPNGSIIKIMQPSKFVRGHRYHGMIVDSAINEKTVKEVILPHLISFIPYEPKRNLGMIRIEVDNPSNRLYYCSICENDLKERENMLMSEYELPREPRFYEDENIGILPKTNCNISMPSVKPPSDNGYRLCNTCTKEDVCMYKGECAQAAKEITKISERTNVFIDTDIRCKKWSGKISNVR